jgi:translation elongation factor EF-1alpha
MRLQSDMTVWVVDEIPDPGNTYHRYHLFHEAALMITGANMKCAVVAVNKMDQRVSHCLPNHARIVN